MLGGAKVLSHQMHDLGRAVAPREPKPPFATFLSEGKTASG